MYSEGEMDRASLPKSSEGCSPGPPATPRLAPPLPPSQREGHTLPIHHHLPEPNPPPSEHLLSPPIPKYPAHPPPIQDHPHIRTPSHGRCPTLTKNESVRMKTRKGGDTYYKDWEAGSTPNACNDDAPHTSQRDGQGPCKRSNDPAQSAGRHRQGKDIRSNQMSHKRQQCDRQGERGRTP
jgi:hypothetical protein